MPYCDHCFQTACYIRANGICTPCSTKWKTYHLERVEDDEPELFETCKQNRRCIFEGCTASTRNLICRQCTINRPRR